MKESNAPTIGTEKYIFFGRIDVVCQAAAGQGIVTSAVLQSDDLDEVSDTKTIMASRSLTTL